MLAAIPGAELYFDIDGLGAAPERGRLVERPPLFLLHGGPGGDHSSFKTQVTAELRSVAQLIYVDHRGSGRSTVEDPASCTLDNNIDDLEALRKHLGLSRISLLGSSYGGMVAQGYAIRYPQSLGSLILAATAPSHRFIDDAKREVAERGTGEQRRVCQWLWDGAFQSLEQLYEYYKAMGPWYSTCFQASQFEQGWQLGRRNYAQLNLGFSTFLREFDYIDALSQISCPTLVLSGQHDWICAAPHGRLIAERIPRAHFKLFRHSAHSLAQDEPSAFLDAVRGFLTCLP